MTGANDFNDPESSLDSGKDLKIWNVNVVLSLLQGVDGKDGDPGPAGTKGDKVRQKNKKSTC